MSIASSMAALTSLAASPACLKTTGQTTVPLIRDAKCRLARRARLQLAVAARRGHPFGEAILVAPVTLHRARDEIRIAHVLGEHRAKQREIRRIVDQARGSAC